MGSPEGHNITIRGRKNVEVTGVSSVESFDANEFFLVTSGGPLQIHGSNLHMKHLDLQEGEVIIEGTVASVDYVADRKKKKSIAKRLFR